MAGSDLARNRIVAELTTLQGRLHQDMLAHMDDSSVTPYDEGRADAADIHGAWLWETVRKIQRTLTEMESLDANTT